MQRVSDTYANDASLADIDSAGGIDSGISEGSSSGDPILTGHPALDQLIRAFHKMQKQLADEALQRAKKTIQVNPALKKMVVDFSDSLTKFFGGLFAGRNFLHGSSERMSPVDIAMSREMLKEQHRELQREIRAVEAIIKQRERTEPLKEIMKPAERVPTPEPKAVEAKAQPAPLSQHFTDFFNKTVVLNKAQDIVPHGNQRVLRSGWLSEKVHQLRQEYDFWHKPFDAGAVEREVLERMARGGIPASQAFQAVLKESGVKPGDAQYAANIVAQEYTRQALKAEGKAEVGLDEEAQKRYAALYKRAASGTDAKVKAIHDEANAEGLKNTTGNLKTSTAKINAALRISKTGKKLKVKPTGDDGSSGTTNG